jgi:hypothetical protein
MAPFAAGGGPFAVGLGNLGRMDEHGERELIEHGHHDAEAAQQFVYLLPRLPSWFGRRCAARFPSAEPRSPAPVRFGYRDEWPRQAGGANNLPLARAVGSSARSDISVRLALDRFRSNPGRASNLKAAGRHDRQRYRDTPSRSC